MTWCEANRVHYVFGFAKNERLVAEIAGELARAERISRKTGKPARCFKSFMYQTRRGWTQRRRAVGKAEFTEAREDVYRWRES
jgi:Transposase DDE domain group 1